MPTKKHNINQNKLDQVVAQARKDSEKRGHGYREQALKLYPWICGRCARSFSHSNLRELTVHHKNHDHDFNPTDGSNWELLCQGCCSKAPAWRRKQSHAENRVVRHLVAHRPVSRI